MKYTQGVYPILSVNNLAKDVYDVTVQCTEIASKAVPGQFVHIRVDGFTLRRPISICAINKEEGTLRLVYEVRGEGTKEMSKLQEGQAMDILGPLGNGFTLLDKSKKALFVGGGIGTPPLLATAAYYGKNATAVLGFRSKTNVILEDDYNQIGATTFVSTDDGSYKKSGFVTQVVQELLSENHYDVVYTCGPNVMMEAVAKLAWEKNVPCQVSMEERMACGVGACLVCACKVKKDGDEYFLHVCKDGPVFDSKEVF